MCNWSFLLLRVIQPLLNSCCGGRLGAPFNSCACNTISNGACYCVFAAQTNVVYQFASQIELSIISRAGWFGKSALGLHRCYCVDAASKINPRRTIDSLSFSLCYILFVFFSLRPPPLSLSLFFLQNDVEARKALIDARKTTLLSRSVMLSRGLKRLELDSRLQTYSLFTEQQNVHTQKKKMKQR